VILVRTSLILFIVFLNGNLWAMKSIDERIEKLESKRSAMKREVERASGGNSTIHYRFLMKLAEADFAPIDQQIEDLKEIKKLRSKL
jgi:hypothetical protein